MAARPTSAMPSLFVLLCSLLYTFATAQFSTFDTIRLPVGYATTSAAAVTAATTATVDVFYRGPRNQLLHVRLSHDGKIKSTRDLGGFLLSAPAAVSTGRAQMDVAYVDENLHVVHRAWRAGKWSTEKRVGLRSAHSPALAVVAGSHLDLFATTLTGHVKHLRLRQNKWMSNPIPATLLAAGAPAVASHRDFAVAGVHLIARRSDNTVHVLDVTAKKPVWKPVLPGLRIASDMCASVAPERGIVFMARAASGKLMAAFRFPRWATRAVASPPLAYPPGCYLALDYCAFVVLAEGDSLALNRYCS